MANKNLGSFIRTALAIAALSACQFASALVVTGDYVKISDSPAGNLGGGAFLTTEINANGSAMTGEKSFYTFCLEKYESFSVGETLKVAGVNNYTTNSSTGTAGTYYATSLAIGGETGHTATKDPLKLATEWLFTKFNTDTTFRTSVLASDAAANSFQRAIWYMEGELFGSTKDSSGKTDLQNYNNDTVAKNLVTLANNSSAGWIDKGNQVRVLNLMKKDKYGNYTVNSQDQLYFVSAVPEVETYAMMLAGLGVVAAVARRRKAKKA